MCGIIAYKSGEDVRNEVIFNGLKKLEYRGYDSWGFVEKTADGFNSVKKVGEISGETPFTNSSLAIGHTRWATHGKVTDVNAHPHFSNDGRIFVVHNGIIENYRELKKSLVEKGYKFLSETDTEAIPNLIQEKMKVMNFEEAVKSALNELEGNFAVAVMSLDDDALIGARKGSPLVVGVGNGEFFLASDIPAFMDRTKNIIYLYDNDFVVIRDGISIENIAEGKKVVRPVQSITWDAEQAKKGNFEHFMLKEISEQAETIQKAIQQDNEEINEIARRINDASGVCFVACGSSYHACLTASYLFSSVAKKHVNVFLASEFENYDGFLDEDTLVIAVSQSGETADVLEAVKIAKFNGCRTMSIVNVVGSSLTRECDNFLNMNAGPEICVLSTKSYTSQLSLLTLLAYASAGKTNEGKLQLKNLYNSVFNLTSANTRNHLKQLAERMKKSEHAYLIGRGLQYPTAMEAALKIKEVSYVHAEAWPAGELKHGSIALIEKGSPVIAFFDEKNEKQMASNASETKARGAYLIGVGPRNNEVFDFFVKVQDVGPLNPVLQIIPMQILAYELAVTKGLNPDKPRNLAKSVTVK